MDKQGKKWWGALLAMAALCAGGARAQVAVDSAPQAAASKPTAFEVVSVRKSKAEYPGGYGYTRDGIDLKGFPVAVVISMAYQFNDYDRLLGLAGWCFGERYDIEAKVPDADVAVWNKLDSRAKGLALQGLLAERFKLKAHRETRDGKIYELVVAKDGPKFKPAPVDVVDPDAPPSHIGVTVGGAETLDELARVLPNLGISRPVVNNTGLAGEFILPLRLMPDSNSLPSEPRSDSSIIDALQEQLGLSLKPSNGPVEMLVIDHVERPAEN